MAVTLGKSPIIMSAQGDAIVDDGVRMWKATTFRVVTTSNSGVCKVLDKAGGNVIFESRSMNANDVDEVVGLSYHYDGFYVQDLPAGASLYIYYK